jgi:hypothetical protein
METTELAAHPQVNGRRGVLTWIRRAFGWEQPSREEIRRRIRSKPGLYARLSPEALEYLRTYDGPEFLGPPDTPRRPDLDYR